MNKKIRSVKAPSRHYSPVLAFLFVFPLVALVSLSAWAGVKTPLGLLFLLVAVNVLVLETFSLFIVLRLETIHTKHAMEMSSHLLSRIEDEPDWEEIQSLLADNSNTYLGSTCARLLIVDRFQNISSCDGEQGLVEFFQEIDFGKALTNLGNIISLEDISNRSANVEQQTLRQALQSTGVSVLLRLGDSEHLLGFALLWGERLRATAEAEVRLNCLGVHLSTVVSDLTTAQRADNLQHSFELAGGLQEALMPSEQSFLCQGLRIYGAYRAAEHCGGDLWIYKDLGAGRVLFFIGDATGHGPPAAILGATVKGVVEAYSASHGADTVPGELLAYVDDRVRRVGKGKIVMTAFAAIVEGKSGRIQYANAGHNFPYFFSEKQGKVCGGVLTQNGNYLGGPAPVSPKTHIHQADASSKLIIYTDGITESVAPDGTEFGDRNFRRLLQANFDKTAEQLVKKVMSSVEVHCDGTAPNDDLTLIVVDLPPRNTAPVRLTNSALLTREPMDENPLRLT